MTELERSGSLTVCHLLTRCRISNFLKSVSLYFFNNSGIKSTKTNLSQTSLRPWGAESELAAEARANDPQRKNEEYLWLLQPGAAWGKKMDMCLDGSAATRPGGNQRNKQILEILLSLRRQSQKKKKEIYTHSR